MTILERSTPGWNAIHQPGPIGVRLDLQQEENAFRNSVATEADIPALVALMTDFYAESDFVLPDTAATRAFSALFASPALGSVWLAEDSGVPVGHIVLAISFSMEYGGLRGFIDDLYVRPTARGQWARAADASSRRAGARHLGKL